MWDETVRISELIWVRREQEYFCKWGWTRQLAKRELICPTGKSVGASKLWCDHAVPFGLCNRPAAFDASKCCGGPALSAVDAHCAADANARQQGNRMRIKE